jgi:hypothetical protein
MKKEYDFSKGVRGKFYRRNAKLNFPIYLEPEVADFLRTFAGKKKTEVEKIVNDWLRKDIKFIKAAK